MDGNRSRKKSALETFLRVQFQSRKICTVYKQAATGDITNKWKFIHRNISRHFCVGFSNKYCLILYLFVAFFSSRFYAKIIMFLIFFRLKETKKLVNSFLKGLKSMALKMHHLFNKYWTWNFIQSLKMCRHSFWDNNSSMEYLVSKSKRDRRRGKNSILKH